MPTMPLTDDGQTIEPSVSVPTATADRFADTATPEPELEPHGLLSASYGFTHWPPRALHPLLERVERKFAHSDRLALPRITAPASRSRPTRNASRAGATSPSANDPAVVFMRSAVSTLSFTSTGIPWSGPRTRPERRSASSVSAISSAWGFVSSTERSAPSTNSIRSR
jgi:hypothetical protein